MSSEPTPGLGVDGVTVRYGRRLALDEIDLTIGPGELVCLVGPNGAGKSTLVRCLTGTVRPDRGQVVLDGQPLSSMPRGALARRVAVVSGSTHLPFAMRVEDLVMLGRTPYLHGLGRPSPADGAAVDATLVKTGIVGLRDRDVRSLSMGERQMVLISMALAQGGDILVLDEPTVHLDLRHQIEVVDLLQRLSREDGMTVIAVLHDLSLAAASFARILVLQRGRVVADGPAPAVLSEDLVRDVYGVDPRRVMDLGGVFARV